MDHQQPDPYEALNIPRSASQSQIKSAYRKLALKYHPDRHRNQSEETRKQYSDMFTKIGNAYEILGDEKRKEHYDRFGVVGDDHDLNASHSDERNHSQNYSRRSGSSSARSFHDPFGGFGSFFGGGDPFMNDPFFNGGGRSSSGGGGGSSRRSNGGRRNNGGFMDPFEIFQEFFGEDFSHNFHNEEYMSSGHGHHQNNSRSQRFQQQQHHNGGGFNGGFGRMEPMGMGMGMGMSMGGFGGFGGFGGGGMNGHMNAMNAMMNMQSNFPSQGNGLASNGNSSMYYSSSSSSNFGGGGGGSVQESVSTSTRIINGKRQTVTERVKVHPDGRVERTTETTGDDDFPQQHRLQEGQGYDRRGQYLEQNHSEGGYQHEQKQEEHRRDVHNDSSSSSEPQKKKRFFTRR